MNRKLRSFKYIFIQAEQIFALAVGLGIFLMILFEGFKSFKGVIQPEALLGTAAFHIPTMGILLLSLVLGSYYQLLCPFYLSFSTTRKDIYLSMKAIAFIPLLELFLLSAILLLFADDTAKTTVIASYPGLIGLSFIGFSLGECMGVISLKFVKFGRIFPALLGGIGGGIGGFCTSFFADVEQARNYSMATLMGKHADLLLIIGIPLYLIVNIFVYRVLKKLTAH